MMDPHGGPPSMPVSICAHCKHVVDGDRCSSRTAPQTVKPRRVNPVTGDMMPHVASLAVCSWRNAKGDCADFDRRPGFEPVRDLAADLGDEPPAPPPPRSPRDEDRPGGFFAWLFSTGGES